MDWIGVDLDRTLAHCDRFISETTIGEPIMPMVERVQGWLDAGKEVRIFTARLSHPARNHEVTVAAIEAWCLKHIGRKLPITNVKDWECEALYDDIAVGVVANTGLTYGEALALGMCKR